MPRRIFLTYVTYVLTTKKELYELGVNLIDFEKVCVIECISGSQS